MKIPVIIVPSTHACVLAVFALCCILGCNRPADVALPPQPNEPSLRPEAAPSPEAQSQESAQDSSELHSLFEKADELLAQNQADQALAMFTNAFCKEEMRPFRADILFRIINTCLSLQKIENAQNWFLDSLENDPEIVYQSFGLIENELIDKQRFDDLIAWCNRIIKIPFIERFMPTVAVWHFKALMGAKTPNSAQKILEQYAPPLLPRPIWLNTAEGMAFMLLNEPTHDAYQQLLAYLESLQKDQPDIRPLYAKMQMQILAAEKKWTDASAFFTKCAEHEDEQTALNIFLLLQNALLSEQLTEAADASSKLGLAQTNKPALRQAAAQSYCRFAIQAKDIALTLGRIMELRDMGLDSNNIIGWLNSSYQLVMSKGTEPDFKAFLAIAQPLLASKPDEAEHSVLACMIMDFLFRLENYADALKLLDTGVPGFDEKWHMSNKNKLLAHLALQQGHREEALERFTKFLNEIAESFDTSYDPITDDTITRDMILALNHKRIGEIQASLGRAQDAQASFKLAREHYEASLKTIKQDTALAKRLQLEYAAIPPLAKPSP